MACIKIYSLIPPLKSDGKILVPNPALDEDDVYDQLCQWLDADGNDIKNLIMKEITDNTINYFCSKFPKTADWITCIIIDKKEVFESHGKISSNKVMEELKILNELEIYDGLHIFTENINKQYPWLEEAYWAIKDLEYSL